MDLFSHLYYQVLDINEIHPLSKKVLIKTRDIYLYEDKVDRGQLYERLSLTISRAIQDISWTQIIIWRVFIVRDINANSSMRNSHCRQNVNVGPLKKLIKSYELMVNNNTNFSTRLSSLRISIIDLALINSGLGLFRM